MKSHEKLQSGCGCLASRSEQLNRAPLNQPTGSFNRSSGTRRRDPGNNSATAFKLQSSLGSRQLTNLVSVSDPDFFRLKLRKRRLVHADVANLFGDSLSFTIQRAQGLVVDADPIVSAGQRSQNRPIQLDAGTYFIRIESSSAVRSVYRFEVSIKKVPRDSGSFNGDNFGGNFGGGGFTGGSFTCSDFSSQSQAQASLGSNPGLDGDGDGIACESLPRF